MEKKYKYRLKQELKNLPSYVPKDNLWLLIEKELLLDEQINEQIEYLPVHEPKHLNWSDLSDKIDLKGKSLKIRYFLQIAAASILILMSITFWFTRQNSELLIETEIVDNSLEQVFDNEMTEHDPINGIKALCNSGVSICQSSEFTEKLGLYEELNEELKQLNEVVNQLGESPEIIHSIIKIENLKSETLQELISLIHA